MTRYVIALTGAILAALSLLILWGAAHAGELERCYRRCERNNPSIADGQTGQICILENVDATGTDCITLTDSTKGMQLSGNFTLCPNDTIILIYDGTDWIELSEMDN